MWKLFITVGALVGPAFAQAQTTTDGFAQCDTIRAPDRRLKCYDALPKRSADTGSSKVATPDQLDQQATPSVRVLVQDSTNVPADLREVVRASIGEFVRDPESMRVTYQAGYVHAGFATICGRYNAKNAFGAYVGYEWYIARARLDGSKWVPMGDPEIGVLVYEESARQACAAGEQ